jgi:hypothetical protein
MERKEKHSERNQAIKQLDKEIKGYMKFNSSEIENQIAAVNSLFDGDISWKCYIYELHHRSCQPVL